MLIAPGVPREGEGENVFVFLRSAVVDSASFWQPLFQKMENGSSESFFEIDDPRSVLNVLSKRAILAIFCRVGRPQESLNCTVSEILCQLCTD